LLQLVSRAWEGAFVGRGGKAAAPDIALATPELATNA
jgi:hypothetical protein